MRFYTVPGAILLALLALRVDAANLILKSRAIPPGGHAGLPVYATAVSQNQLWAVDFALTFANSNLSAHNPTAAFTPTSAGVKDITRSSSAIIGPSGPNGVPNLYVIYAHATSGMDPSKSLGLIDLQVASGAVAGSVINIAVYPYDLPARKDGTIALRPGASAVTSTATPKAAIVKEPLNLLDNAPYGLAAVPAHMVAVGIPGDINGDGHVNVADVTLLANMLAGNAPATNYRLIAADVAPSNGYTGMNIGGDNGFGYGDGQITVSDLSLLARRASGQTTPDFPLPQP